MATMWEVTFKEVSDPETFTRSLQACLFWGRCNNPGVTVVGDRVVFSFESSHTRSDITKKVTQSFKQFGSFRGYLLADRNAISADSPVAGITYGEAASASGMDRSAAPATLAIRSSVEEIKRLAAGLSSAECHALVVYFGLKVYQSVGVAPQFPQYKDMFEQKLKAAKVFTDVPAGEWRDSMREYAGLRPPRFPCKCNCQCDRVDHTYSLCHGCLRTICGACAPLSERLRSQCHHCEGRDKKAYTIPSLDAEALDWYFNTPDESRPDQFGLPHPTRRTCRWINKNRAIEFDPVLIRVNSIYKHEMLTNRTRHVRPPAWESAFTVSVALGGIADSTVETSIDLFSFMMNPAWKEHGVVKWLRDEWMMYPTSLDVLGHVAVFEPPRVMYNPECINPNQPSTPDPFISTVQIEEVVEDNEYGPLADELDWEYLNELRGKKRSRSQE